MQYNYFGNTNMLISRIGFGAWGIGGPVMAGDIPIGWGKTDDMESIKALEKAYNLGINFFDTADFYGLGHSETLIGNAFGNTSNVTIATKVGHRLLKKGSIVLDYSFKHIVSACEASLRRLKRETIDYYQLHSAKLEHLQNGECIEAMIKLQEHGKIRFWGISLSTYDPSPEAEFFMENEIGHGFQIAFNVINQKARDLIMKAKERGYGIIARMPLQFGLLAKKFDESSKFAKNDHRHFRLNPDVLKKSLEALKEYWTIAGNYQTNPAQFSLNYILNHKEISTVIPGIKTREQAEENAIQTMQISEHDMLHVRKLYENKLKDLLEYMQHYG